MSTPMTKDGVANRSLLEDGTTVYQTAVGDRVRRFGWTRLRQIARASCSVVQANQSRIRAAFGQNVYVMIALEAALIACALLEQIADDAAEGNLSVNAPIGFEDVPSRLRTLADQWDAGSLGGGV